VKQARHSSPEPDQILSDELSRDGFGTIFHTAPCGMLLANGGGCIIAVNERLTDLFGYSEAELIGQPIEMLLPQRFRAGHVAQRDGYAAAPTARAMGQGRDLTGRRKDGVEFPLEIGLSSIAIPTGQVTCASIIDITMRLKSELRLREANAQLEEFTYVASHDLRSPIRGIANLIEMVREDLGEQAGPLVLRNLVRMEERVKSMELLIRDLLTYARAGNQKGKNEPIDLRELVLEVIKMEAPHADFTIILDITDQIFEGPRSPLSTVIRNLLSNAIKHHDRPNGTITIRCALDDAQCTIDVIDDGPGIPECAHARVFRLFQTLSASQRQNSGLGLAMVQRLVERHGGKVQLESNDQDRGAWFRVIWPRFARADRDD